ncbi:hypothetical protein HDV02_001241 [Globomyces sp. JEL0801]|nr:hypothetical protein HDV02_001241 [Globomyces sp. JEL0801]
MSLIKLNFNEFLASKMNEQKRQIHRIKSNPNYDYTRNQILILPAFNQLRLLDPKTKYFPDFVPHNVNVIGVDFLGDNQLDCLDLALTYKCHQMKLLPLHPSTSQFRILNILVRRFNQTKYNLKKSTYDSEKVILEANRTSNLNIPNRQWFQMMASLTGTLYLHPKTADLENLLLSKTAYSYFKPYSNWNSTDLKVKDVKSGHKPILKSRPNIFENQNRIDLDWFQKLKSLKSKPLMIRKVLKFKIIYYLLYPQTYLKKSRNFSLYSRKQKHIPPKDQLKEFKLLKFSNSRHYDQDGGSNLALEESFDYHLLLKTQVNSIDLFQDSIKKKHSKQIEMNDFHLHFTGQEKVKANPYSKVSFHFLVQRQQIVDADVCFCKPLPNTLLKIDTTVSNKRIFFLPNQNVIKFYNLNQILRRLSLSRSFFIQPTSHETDNPLPSPDSELFSELSNSDHLTDSSACDSEVDLELSQKQVYKSFPLDNLSRVEIESDSLKYNPALDFPSSSPYFNQETIYHDPYDNKMYHRIRTDKFSVRNRQVLQLGSVLIDTAIDVYQLAKKFIGL